MSEQFQNCNLKLDGDIMLAVRNLNDLEITFAFQCNSQAATKQSNKRT